MKFNPYKYQEQAISWILDHPRCALFLDMGLGKSVITLTAISQLIDYAEMTKALVVAPKKVAETTWTSEAAKWDHLKFLTVVKVVGSPAQRIAALRSEADVYVIGRDSFVWLLKYYKGKLPFDTLVIDELTSFKSHKSSRFKAMRIASPSFSRVIGLTGTPVPNGLADLWAQMFCIDLGERLGKFSTKFQTLYFNPVVWNNIVIKLIPKPGASDIIKEKISDICLSMQARDYLQLPEMIEHDDLIELPEGIASQYKAFEKENVLKVVDECTNKEGTVIATAAAALMNKLSQFANGAVYDEARTILPIHDEKIDRLLELIEGLNGQSVLIFYQYKHDVSRIIKALGKSYKVRKYETNKDLEDWNAGKIDVMLAHPASTAFGLNMQQGGHYIVWFGLTWNLELYMQANARLHRQGQTQPVHIYKILCKGTVDELANSAISRKASTQQSLIDALKILYNNL